jgi:hypothetical protein
MADLHFRLHHYCFGLIVFTPSFIARVTQKKNLGALFYSNAIGNTLRSWEFLEANFLGSFLGCKIHLKG